MSETPKNSPKTALPVALGGARAWFVWSLSALAFGYAFFQRVAPSVMGSDLMAEFAIGGAMLGLLSALYFYPYVLLQVPLGAILDRLGARLLLFSALSLAGLGSALFAAADGLALAYVGRILIGIGSAVGFLASLALAAAWFPKNRFALLSGMTMFFGMMSGVLAQGPLALFVEKFGWRASMWSLGAFGVFLALMILIFVRNAPPHRQNSHRPEVSWADVSRNLIRALGSWDVWKIAIVAAAMSGPMLALGALWGTPYLVAAYKLETAQAAFYVSLMLLGWAFGAPSAGWLSDRTQMRKSLLIFCCFVLTLALGILVFLPLAPLTITVGLFIVIGFFGGGMATTFALVRATTPEAIGSSATGIVNGMTVASGALLQPLVGVLLDANWSGAMEAGARVYQISDYRTAFICIFCTAAIGLITSLMLKEN